MYSVLRRVRVIIQRVRPAGQQDSRAAGSRGRSVGRSKYAVKRFRKRNVEVRGEGEPTNSVDLGFLDATPGLLASDESVSSKLEMRRTNKSCDLSVMNMGTNGQVCTDDYALSGACAATLT